MYLNNIQCGVKTVLFSVDKSVQCRVLIVLLSVSVDCIDQCEVLTVLFSVEC